MQLPIPDSDRLPLPDAIAREAFPPPAAKKKAPPAKKKAPPPEEDEEPAPKDEEPDEEEPVEDDEEDDSYDEDIEYEEAPVGNTAAEKLHGKPPTRGKTPPPKKKKPKAVTVTIATEAHGEIHSAKAHRCVDKVAAKGGVDEPWAVCTASIGKSGVYAKGHGGSASPKRKTRETREVAAEMDAYVEGLVEEIRRAR